MIVKQEFIFNNVDDYTEYNLHNYDRSWYYWMEACVPDMPILPKDHAYDYDSGNNGKMILIN